jgi:hypothetical protein
LLDPIECRHRERSRRMILRAAEGVAPGRAIVLGAGACEEIPLAELAARFAEVALNDVDQQSLARALDALELNAVDRQKIKIRFADLTGMIQPALGAIQRALATVGDAPRAIDAMSGALDNVVAGEFPITGRYDLVIASCVLSQLHFALVHEAARQFEARFGGQAEALRESDRWKAVVWKIARRMEDKLVVDLTTIVGPGGLVYLAESAQMCYIRLADGGRWQSEGTYRMLRTTDLADYLQGRFTIVERGRWEWVVWPPRKAGDVGRLYDVQALVLRPR